MNQNSPKTSQFSRGMKSQNEQGNNDSVSPALPKRSTFIRDAKVSKSVPKSSPRDLALFRNIIPASPLNVFKGGQPRHMTLEIFKKQKQFDKVYVPDKLTKSKNGINNQIQKSDSVDRVKHLVEQAKKDDENHFYIKKGSKAKGTMYINELWGQKYEEKTIKAASIHKELAAKEKNSWRPLQQHLDDVVELYEKRHKKNMITFQIGENSGDKTPTSSADGEDSRPTSKAPSQFQKLQADNQSSPANNYNGLFVTRHSSLPHIGKDVQTFDMKEISSTPRNKLTVKTSFLNEAETTYATAKDFESGAIEESAGKKARAFTLGSPKVSEGDHMSFSHQLYNLQENGMSPFFRNKGSKVNSPYSAKGHSRISSYADSPMAHEGVRNKMFLNDKVHNLNHLMQKCDEELDERTQWMNVMNNMQGLFLTPKYNKKIKYEEAHKQKMIENCQELFKLKMKGKK